jgi:hypothetical protein
MTSPTLPDLQKSEIVIIEMTNDYRAKNHLQAVKGDAKLTNAARAFAAHIARTGTFTHDADGRQPADRARNAGYQYCYIAENLALNQSSVGFETRDLARRMVEGWINSPGHRSNMLAPQATDIAVAIARGPDKDPKFIAVQMFARPKALAYEFQISNATAAPVRYAFDGRSHELKPGVGAVHTSCIPGSIEFEATAAEPKGAAGPAARYEARDGQLYVLEKAAGGYRVNVRQKERIR